MRTFRSGLMLISILWALAFAPAAIGQGSERARCAAGPGATGAPKNIEQFVDLINSLPKPVTIPCFIESLDRPLDVLATNSTLSLQLSTRPSDPRIFILSLPLIISVTSDGPGANLIEVGVLQPGDKRTLMGELRLPLSENVSYARPYERIRVAAGTGCALCHGDEQRNPKISFTAAFDSRAIRPFLDSEVSLETLRRLKSECRPETNPARCALLRALFDHGPVRRQDFPPGVPSGL